MITNNVRRGSIACTAALLAAAGSAAASIEGTGVSVSIWNADTGSMWVNDLSVTGEFDGDNRYVARIDLDGVFLGQDGNGNDVMLGSEDFVEYEIVGNNLRAGATSFTANLNFNVAAGIANTGFSFSASPVAAPLPTANGTASAGITLTESSNPFATGGVTMSPDAGRIYEANYNAGGSIFADLFTSALSVASGGGSDSFSDSFTGPIGVPVTDIGSTFAFTLSAFDLASGTSTFVVTPAPGTAALLGLGGMLAARRRR